MVLSISWLFTDCAESRVKQGPCAKRPGTTSVRWVMRSSRIDAFFLLFRLDFDDFNASVATTRGTNLVWQAQFVAFGTRNQVPRLERVMASPLAFAALAQFSFR